MIVEYHAAVHGELEQIRNWYNEKTPGLGDEFINEFERFVWRIAAAPQRWMRVREDVRCGLMSRFPYLIYFRQLDGGRLRVLIVRHSRRNPNHGQRRR